MKRTYVILPALLAVSANAQAFEAAARVIKVLPLTETTYRPIERCSTETHEIVEPARRDPSGAILGTIAGGILGNQLGRGDGRIAGAAVGAGIGAIAGDRIANRDAIARIAVRAQRCQSVDHLETRVAGYRVTYEYDDWRFTTRLPYDPGNTLRVNVAVTPR